MLQGTIFDIKRYAIHDGPGIRTTVFVKGCPLSCAWCHNPEGLSPDVEIVYKKEICLGCRSCVSACPAGALRFGPGGIERDAGACTLCLTCIEACPAEALESTGRTISVDSLMEEIRKDLPFFEASGGGVTFSGGEPTLQGEFLLAVLEACGREGIHRTVDTSGYCDPGVLKAIAGETDLFLYDLKSMDPQTHLRHTGVDNGLILSNLEMLSRLGYPVEIRIPLIPGVNNHRDHIDRIAGFLKKLPTAPGVRVLPYHDFQKIKYRRLEMAYTAGDIRPPEREEVERVVSIFTGRGLSAEPRGGGL